MKKVSIYILLIISALWVFSCGSDPVNPPPPADEKPSLLLYSPASLELAFGKAGASASPTIKGKLPMSYALSASPDGKGQLTINSSTGVISATDKLEVGTYQLSVTASNSAGSATFDKIFTITVTKGTEAPSALSYSPNSLETTVGTAISSVAPKLSGTSPFTFSMTSTPDAKGKISINTSTGVVSVATDAAEGTYKVSVTAANSASSKTFADALRVVVKPGTSTKTTTFEADIRPLLVGKCASCHTTGTQGSRGQDWRKYADTKTWVEDIIRTTANKTMPPGTNDLTTAEVDLIRKWKTDGLKEK